MEHQITLTDSELQLIRELMDVERGNLHAEVRRSTLNPDVHEQLHERLRVVSALAERLSHAPAAAAGSEQPTRPSGFPSC